MRLGEDREIPLGLRIERAAAADDEGALRLPQQRDRGGEFRRIRARAARRPDVFLEHRDREIVSLGLHILAKPEGDRAALRGIGEHLHGAGEGRDDLLGPRDTVEIPGDRAESIIRADCAVLPILNLLQHRIGAAAGEDIARQQKQRQAIDMGNRGGSDHVQRAGPDGAGAGHDPAAPERLGISSGGMGHGLLIMRAERGQGLPRGIERLPHSCDIAVAEDGPDAAEEGQDLRLPLFAFDNGPLGGHGANQSLSHGETDCTHCERSPCCSQAALTWRASCQAVTSCRKRSAI
jgi:hypothetical protein